MRGQTEFAFWQCDTLQISNRIFRRLDFPCNPRTTASDIRRSSWDNGEPRKDSVLAGFLAVHASHDDAEGGDLDCANVVLKT